MAHQTIGGVAVTVCSLMGVDCAGGGLEDSFAQVLGRAKAFGVNRCDRAILYAPDAIGLHLCEAYPEIMRPVAEAAPTVVRLKSAVPVLLTIPAGPGAASGGATLTRKH